MSTLEPTPTAAPAAPGNNQPGTSTQQSTSYSSRRQETSATSPSFKGATEALDGNIFQMNGPATQYPKTLEKFQLYAATTYSGTPEITSLFDSPPTVPTVQRPGANPDGTGENGAVTLFDQKFFEETVKGYFRKAEELKGNLHALFLVIYGQCDPVLKSHLQSLSPFSASRAEGKCLWLLQEIRRITSKFDTKTYVHDAVHVSLCKFYSLHQGTKSTNEYFRMFEDAVAALDLNHAWTDPPLALNPDARLVGDSDAATRRNIREAQFACHFVLNADNKRFASFKNDLRSSFSRGTNQWPITLVDAYKSLLNEEATAERNGRPDIQQRERGTAGRSGGDGRPGGRGPQGHARGHQYHQASRVLQRRDALLLDTLSSHSLLRSTDQLSELRRSDLPLELQTQAGIFSARETATFTGLPGCSFQVWHSPLAIADVLALCDVVKVCRVTMDSGIDRAMIVHCPNGTQVRFGQLDNGLYGLLEDRVNDTSDSPSPYSFLQTVSGQKQLFTARQVKAAEQARELSRKLGRPSNSTLEHCLAHGHILNCPVTVEDLRRAEIIFGPDIAFLKGHSTDSPNGDAHVRTLIPSPLPPHIAEHHSNLTLCVDFFYVQRIPFIHCISRDIRYRHTFAVDNRLRETMSTFVSGAIREYTLRGFTVRGVHADSEFECIEPDIRPVALDVVTANGHVPEVERSIRTMKEDLRAVVHGMPFKRLPKLVIQHLVRYATQNLNQLPRPASGILQHCSPESIVTGRPRPDFNALHIEFGSYVQIFDSTTNTLRSRTLGAIALDRTGRADGSYYFISLKTGRLFSKTAGACTVLPITDIAIRRLEQLAKEERQPLLQKSNLLIEWRPDQPFDEDEYDADYPSDDESTDSDDDDDDFPFDEPITPDELAELLAPVDAPDFAEAGAPEPEEVDEFDDPADDTGDNVFDGDEMPYGAADADGPNFDEVGANPQGNHIPFVEEAGVTQAPLVEETGAGVTIDDCSRTEPMVTADASGPEPRYGLRVGRQRSYAHRLSHQMDDAPSNAQSYSPASQFLQASHQRDVVSALSGVMLYQMSAKAGIRKHGDAARDALRDEFRQMIDKRVYTPLRGSDISPDEKKKVLRAINVIKEKRCGKIKGRHCADGSVQRDWYEKHETSSPTLSTDALLLSLIVDAHEGRDVATADVAGAYLNADMDELVILRLTGEDVTLMCDVNPEFLAFVEVETGQRVLYLRLDKALYGCVRSALLWYRLFTKTLLGLGFMLNPYDPCVANAIIDGTQCTVAWYVDDNKISHLKSVVVDRIIEAIEAEFGPMTVTRGTRHEFLGMDIEFIGDKRVQITMKKYLKDAVINSNLGICRKAATPATKALFELDDGSPLLPVPEAHVFHRVVSQLLYVSLRGRPDLLPTVSFLCTRVSKPTDQDQRKLRRLLEYVDATIDLHLTISAEKLDTLYTFVDAAYGVHDDMKSQTGGVTTFGLGGVLCRASKQKINTKSSTEAELVGASDYLSHTVWVHNFLRAQGYPLRDSFFEQDNESAIKLAKNGRASAGARSRHINIRYFWIKDRLASDNITLRHCDTESMLADFLTKPLQGSLFRKFRDVLLGYQPLSILGRTNLPRAVERVEVNPAEAPVAVSKTVTWSDIVRRGSLSSIGSKRSLVAPQQSDPILLRKESS